MNASMVSVLLCLLDDKKDKKKEKKPLEAAPPSHVGRRKKPKGAIGATKLPNGKKTLKARKGLTVLTGIYRNVLRCTEGHPIRCMSVHLPL